MVSLTPSQRADMPATGAMPAEAFTMQPRAASASHGMGDHGNNLDATIESRDVVGPIVRFLLAVEGGQSVTLESHTERYGPSFAAGSPVRVSWDAAKATIIPAVAT